jgi:hypothetical protein
MKSLNEIAYFIAARLGKESDFKTLQEIKAAIKINRALILRRDVERNSDNPSYVQHFYTKLIEVNEYDNCLVQGECTILRTENKIPRPVRLKDHSPFKYVGIAGFENPFTYLDMNKLTHIKYRTYTSNKIYYSYNNEYIYILKTDTPETDLLEYLLIQGVFTNPEEAVTNCIDSINCFSDDDPFPLPEDLIPDIINTILQGFMIDLQNPRVMTKENEIKINEDKLG